MIQKEHWDRLHKDSVGKHRRVTDFAKLCYYNFMKNKKGKVLDLGSGKGSDSIYFHNKGFDVTAVDYSSEAISEFNDIQREYEIFVTSLVKDVLDPLPFAAESFDFIYSRLLIYYFTDEELKKVLSEVKRVLKSEGLFMFQVKSVNDKSYGLGKEIEKDMFEEEDGHPRHFFSKEYVESLLEDDYTIVMVEERKVPNGSAYLEVVAEKKV